MPVFDNPKKELRRLHEQLLAEEEEDFEDLEEEFDQEDYEDFFEEDYREGYAREPLIRNFSNGYGSDIRNFANGYRGDALMDDEDEIGWDTCDREPYALQVETKRERKRRLKQEKQTDKKGGGFLKCMLVLELMGLFGILMWWVVNVW